MGILLHFLTYVCMVIFVFAVVAKFLQYKGMPLHVRWELYPVAHEEGDKPHYGGSYFEETNWWTHKRKPNRVSELRHMVPEMMFLVAVKEHNPSLWLRTFPFHFGMYILIGFLGLLSAGAVFQQVAIGSGLTGALNALTMAAGFAGAILGIIGALGLLHRRLADEDLKDFTKPADILNLVFLLAVFALILVSGILSPSFSGLRGYVQSVIFFNVEYMPGDPASTGAVVLGSLVVAYIPLTHMAHFVVKYFTYHNIRWDDTPNMRGSAHEKKIGEMLNYPCTWSAEHINPEGAQKSWVQICLENPTEKKETK